MHTISPPSIKNMPINFFPKTLQVSQKSKWSEPKEKNKEPRQNGIESAHLSQEPFLTKESFSCSRSISPSWVFVKAFAGYSTYFLSLIKCLSLHNSTHYYAISPEAGFTCTKNPFFHIYYYVSLHCYFSGSSLCSTLNWEKTPNLLHLPFWKINLGIGGLPLGKILLCLDFLVFFIMQDRLSVIGSYVIRLHINNHLISSPLWSSLSQPIFQSNNSSKLIYL